MHTRLYYFCIYIIGSVTCVFKLYLLFKFLQLFYIEKKRSICENKNVWTY